jgi:hypothetical protein
MSDITPAAKIPSLQSASRNVLFHNVTQEQIFASLPKDMDRQQFAALFLDSLEAAATANPACAAALAQQPHLISRAAQRAAALGAIPGRGAKEIALIFRKGWAKKDGTYVPDQLDVMPEWRLYQRKLRGAVGVVNVEVFLVHAEDNFSYNSLTNRVTHEFDPFAEGRTFRHPSAGPNGLRGGYLKIQMDDGSVRYHFCRMDKIEAARACANNEGKSGPWFDWYPEMVRKTIMRDAAAAGVVQWSPLQIDEVSHLMRADDAALDNDPSRGGYENAPKRETPAQSLTAAAGPKGVNKLAAALQLQSEPAPAPVSFDMNPERDLVPLTVPDQQTSRAD